MKSNKSKNFLCEIAFLAVLKIFPVQKLIFGHVWNCKKWILVKLIYLISRVFLTWTFLNILAYCVRVHKILFSVLRFIPDKPRNSDGVISKVLGFLPTLSLDISSDISSSESNWEIKCTSRSKLQFLVKCSGKLVGPNNWALKSVRQKIQFSQQ